MEITLGALPTEERDQILGKYMDAFSRMEFMVNQTIQALLGSDWEAGRALFAVLYSKQRIDLLESLAWIRLPKETAERVSKVCGKLARRNMRRNHIIHGAWQHTVTVSDDGHVSEWVRNYVPTNPDLAAIHKYDDPKLLGTYTFNLPALERATDHVQEVIEILSQLLGDIHTRLAPPSAPEEEQPKPE